MTSCASESLWVQVHLHFLVYTGLGVLVWPSFSPKYIWRLQSVIVLNSHCVVYSLVIHFSSQQSLLRLFLHPDLLYYCLPLKLENPVNGVKAVCKKYKLRFKKKTLFIVLNHTRFQKTLALFLGVLSKVQHKASIHISCLIRVVLQVAKPENGKDVSLNLVLHNKCPVDLPLSIIISVQAMKHVGTPAATLLTQEKDDMLEQGKGDPCSVQEWMYNFGLFNPKLSLCVNTMRIRWKPDFSSLPLSVSELSIPVLIEFSVYNKPMLECASMKVSVVVTDKLNPDNIYVAEDDIVLLDPPISLTVRRKPLKSPVLSYQNNI